MITLSRQQEMKDKIFAFIGGDLLVTLHLWFAGIIADLGNFGLKVVATFIIGAAGGIAGLVAKDYYPKIKVYLKTKFKKKDKPNA